jgi:peptide/nickel transport system substrate-binding protein
MKRLLITGACLALIVLAVGCGSSSSGEGTQTGSAAPMEELTWASTPVQRADGPTGYSWAAFSLIAPVTETLMSYNSEGKVIPGVAHSVDNPNPTTYIYHLKKGIRFSDGKPMTVEDVVFSLRRNQGPEALTGASFENVASIDAQGDDAVVIKLKEPEASWPTVPAWLGQIIEKDAAIKGGLSDLGTPSNLPIGSGPYKFAKFNPQTGATLELNPHWKGQEPTAEKVVVPFYKEDSQLALALRSGEAAGTFWPTSALPFEFPGVELIEIPSVNQMVIGMNTLVPPFNDIHVRKAIAYALDREGMSEAIFGGKAAISSTFTPVSLYGSIAPIEEVERTFEALPSYEFDLAKAKEELAKSKYPDGFSTTFPAEPSAVKIAQVMAPDLAKIGIDMKIEQMTEGAYYEIVYGPRDKIGLTFGYLGSASPDPDLNLKAWLSSKQAVVNGLNSANYKSPEMDRLLEAESKESDGRKRLQLISEMFELNMKDVPYAPLFSPPQYIVVSDGYEITDVSPWTIGFTPWPLSITRAE